MRRNPLWTILLVAAATLPGCGGDTAPEGPGDDSSHHGHVHAAPHGGTLVVLAEEFAHVELVLDPEAGTLTAYCLGPHADTPVRIPAPSIPVTVNVGGAPTELVLAAVADRLSGETVGDTSEFSVRDERLVGLGELHGVIHAVSLRGRDFTDVAF